MVHKCEKSYYYLLVRHQLTSKLLNPDSCSVICKIILSFIALSVGSSYSHDFRYEILKRLIIFLTRAKKIFRATQIRHSCQNDSGSLLQSCGSCLLGIRETDAKFVKPIDYYEF